MLCSVHCVTYFQDLELSKSSCVWGEIRLSPKSDLLRGQKFQPSVCAQNLRRSNLSGWSLTRVFYHPFCRKITYFKSFSLVTYFNIVLSTSVFQYECKVIAEKSHEDWEETICTFETGKCLTNDCWRSIRNTWLWNCQNAIFPPWVVYFTAICDCCFYRNLDVWFWLLWSYDSMQYIWQYWFNYRILFFQI